MTGKVPQTGEQIPSGGQQGMTPAEEPAAPVFV